MKIHDTFNAKKTQYDFAQQGLHVEIRRNRRTSLQTASKELLEGFFRNSAE